jgi:hypothetical protein
VCEAQSINSTSGETRDPAAIAALNKALDISGGRKAWGAIHGTKVRGELTAHLMGKSGSTVVTNSVVWLDDWSTGHVRYNKITTNSEGVAHTLKHNNSSTFSAHNGKKTILASRFDDASILVTHLPGAAMLRILSDDQYSIVSNQKFSDPNHTQVTVSRSIGSIRQIWYFSKVTGQVDAVRFTLPDLLNEGHKSWETVIYKHYRADGALSVPEDVEIIRPNNFPVSFKFKSLELNPNIVARDFNSGVAQ